jgi:hypothetical protein
VSAGGSTRAPEEALELLRASALPGDWILPAWILAAAVVWVAFTTVLGLLAGHWALLARFPPVEEEGEEAFGFASGRIRWVSYNNALHVHVGARGLHLAANGLFRSPFRRAIPCVPWNELRLLRSQAEGWVALFRGSKFEVPALRLGFTLYGRAGLAVERKLASLGLSPPDHARALVRER